MHDHECTCHPGFVHDTLIPQVGVITDIRQETPDVKTFRIEPPQGGKFFEHMPGQCAMICVPGVSEVNIGKAAEDGAYDYIIVPAENADIRKELFFALAESNMPLLSFTEDTVSLEDVFAALTIGGKTINLTGEAADEAAEQAAAEEVDAAEETQSEEEAEPQVQEEEKEGEDQ